MAEQQLLQVAITRVDGALFEGGVRSVTVPGSEGEMTLLAHHKALISALKAGEVRIEKADGTKEVFTVEKGTIEVSNNAATILV